MIEYRIINEVSVLNLEHEVREAIAHGWLPLGGVCVSGDRYHQAMTREAAKSESHEKRGLI